MRTGCPPARARRNAKTYFTTAQTFDTPATVETGRVPFYALATGAPALLNELLNHPRQTELTMIVPAHLRATLALLSLVATLPARAHEAVPLRVKRIVDDCAHDLTSAALVQAAPSAASILEPAPPEAAPEDPYSSFDMKQARATARAVQTHLSDWSFKVEDLNRAKVEKTLKRLRTTVTLDAPAFRTLFGVVGRYLLNAKGADGRLRPMAELLKIKEGEARLLVNFFSQLDTLVLRGERLPSLPYFMTTPDSPAEHLFDDLGEGKLDVAAADFVRGPLTEVLGDRVRYARLSIDATGNQLTLRSPVGIYKINLRQGLKSRPTIARLDVRPTPTWGRQNDFVIHSLIDVNVNDADAVSYLRTMLRADAFLHPHLLPPTLEALPQKTKLSPMQKGVVRDMLVADRAAEAELVRTQTPGPVNLAYMMTTGSGKTPVFADYLTEMIDGRWNGRRPRGVFTVQNTTILRQTLITLVRDHGIDPAKIYLMFGETGEMTFDIGAKSFTVPQGSSLVPKDDWEFIFVSRTTLAANEDWLVKQIARENKRPAASRTPTVLAVDEAHHLEAKDGQYKRLLESVRGVMRNEDRVIGMSATFASKSRNILVEEFRGNVVTPYLFAEEAERARRGEDLDKAALLQYHRATIDGYVNPVDDESFTLLGGGTLAADLKARLARKEETDEDLYGKVADMIREIRRPGLVDRWMFFDVTTDRANGGAEFLRGKFGPASARAMHTDMSVEEQIDTLEWFKDAGEHRGTRAHHKYNVSVGQAVEGTDIRGANGAAIMKNVGSDRSVQQIVGRVARLEPFKTSMRIADPTGRAVSYLSSDEELWTRVRSRTNNERILSGEWSAAAPERVVGPDAAELAAQKFDLAEKLKKQREELMKRREAEVEQIKIFASGSGAIQALATDPATNQRQIYINPRTRVAQWFALFPETTRAQFQDQLADLKWTNPSVNVTNPTATDAIELRAGMNLLVRAFNSLSSEERRGVSDVTGSLRATLAGVAPVFSTLTSTYAFTPSPLLTFPAWTYEQRAIFKAQITSRQLFAKSSQFAKLAQDFANEAPSRILKLLPQIMANRPHLNTDEAKLMLRQARFALDAAERTDAPAQPVAIYHLTLLANYWLGLVNPPPPRPLWDLNVAFGRTPNPSLTQPSMFEFWMMLGSVDTALAVK